MKLTLSFDDVLITPQFSTIASRADVDPTVDFLGRKVLPIISSNMDSVTGVDLAKAMNDYGALAALHRFQSIEDNVNQFKAAPNSIVSLGLGDLELERAAALHASGAETFLIDVAHGATMEVVKQTRALRLLVGKEKKIIVGNFATGQSVKDFKHHLGEKYAIDAIKVGIGGGSACTTRLVTGSGMPTLHSVIDCRASGLPIIADGGIRNSGDLSKALAAGATTVMVGRLLAGTTEAPGELVDGRGYPYHPLVGCEGSFKVYRGSASKESYEVQSKTAPHRAPEGDSFLVPTSGLVADVLQGLEAGLRSSMSYVGARTIDEFRERAELVQVTNAGIKENGAYGKI